MSDQLTDVDAFDLPDWLGVEDVVWESMTGLRSGPLVAGRIVAGDHGHPCDLLAVDEAYPAPTATEDVRVRAHRAWRYGEVLIVDRLERLTLAVPCREFDVSLVLDALARLAKAVGASPDHFAARLRIGES